jgi:hypothetical protein
MDPSLHQGIPKKGHSGKTARGRQCDKAKPAQPVKVVPVFWVFVRRVAPRDQ